MTRMFWDKVKVGSPDECWPWLGYIGNDGYGQFGSKPARAHRVAYTLFTGIQLGNRILRHICDTPRCCNPHHLRPGTHAENVADRVSRGRSATAAVGNWRGGRPRSGYEKQWRPWNELSREERRKVGKARGRRLAKWLAENHK